MIFRHDDFSPRTRLEAAKQIHNEFLKRDLVETVCVETVCIQACHPPVVGLNERIVEYIKSSPNYDVQLHCWEHSSYDEMTSPEVIRDLSAAMFYIRKAFGAYPTVRESFVQVADIVEVTGEY